MSGSGGSTYHHDGQLLLRCVGRGLSGLTLNDPSVGPESFPVVRYESQIDTRLVVQDDRQLMESLVRHATTPAGERESGVGPRLIGAESSGERWLDDLHWTQACTLSWHLQVSRVDGDSRSERPKSLGPVTCDMVIKITTTSVERGRNHRG